MTVEDIRGAVRKAAGHYPISRVSLFGSRASETNRPDSDVDLIVEFSAPISLLTISLIRSV